MDRRKRLDLAKQQRMFPRLIATIADAKSMTGTRPDRGARAFAAGLPDAWEDHPWGETVYKVGKKVFVFFGMLDDDAGLHLTVKLRDSHEEAMAFEWVVPAGYGLDRGGWVSCTVAGRRTARDDHRMDRGELPDHRAEEARRAALILDPIDGPLIPVGDPQRPIGRADLALVLPIRQSESARPAAWSPGQSPRSRSRRL